MYHVTRSTNGTGKLSSTHQSQFDAWRLFWTLYPELRWPLFDSFKCEKPIRLNYPQSVLLNSGPVHSSFSLFIFLLFITVYSWCFPIRCLMFPSIFVRSRLYLRLRFVQTHLLASDVIVLIIYNFIKNCKCTVWWTADNLVLSVKSLLVWQKAKKNSNFVFVMGCYYEHAWAVCFLRVVCSWMLHATSCAVFNFSYLVCANMSCVSVPYVDTFRHSVCQHERSAWHFMFY